MMPPVVLSVVLLNTQSIVIANSSGDKIHPCRASVSTGNHWLISLSNLTALLLSTYNFWMMEMILLGIPYSSRIFHSAGL